MVRMSALTALLVLALGLPPAASATADPQLESTLGVVGTTTDGSTVLLRGDTTVTGPDEPTVVTQPLVSESATVDLSPAQQYQFRYRASPTLSEHTHAGLYHRAGVGHRAWLYGALAPASTVVAGDRRESLVIGSAPYPLYPPREVTAGGHLEWGPVEPQAVTLEARLTDPDTGQVWTQTMDAVSITTTLWARGGGIVAPDGVEAPVLRIPLPGFDAGTIATTRLAGVPGVGPISHSLQTVDDGGGGRLLEVHAALEPGSAWPESGDEAPGGSWGYRAHILAMDLDDATVAANGGAVQLAVGALGPGELLEVVATGGASATLTEVRGAELLLTGEGIQVVTADPLPLPAAVATEPPAGDSPSTWPATTAGDCGSDVESAGAGPRLAAGAVRADLQPDGTLEGMCLSGVPVGAVGLPSVRVDGEPVDPVWDGGGPLINEYAFETASGFYGNVVIVQYSGTAGPVRFDVQMFVMNTDRGGILQPVVWDFHAPGAGAATVHLDWLVDPDSGTDEAFSAYGAAPLAAEAVLPMDGAGHLLGAEPPHLVSAASSPLRHEIRHFGPTDMVVHRRDSMLPAPPLPEAAAVPAEPLVGADVAAHVPTPLAGPYLYAYQNRAPAINGALAAVPPPASGVVNLGLALAPVLAGQVGLAWSWLISGYAPR